MISFMISDEPSGPARGRFIGPEWPARRRRTRRTWPSPGRL